MRIGYVCDAGGTVGWGHLSRALALVESASLGSRILVGPGYSQVTHRWRGTANAELIEPWGADLPDSATLSRFDFLIVDHYRMPAEWIALTSGRLPLAVIDDWMRTRVECTLFVNPNIGCVPGDYPEVVAGEFLLGPRYALLRSTVRALRSDGPRAGGSGVGRILITMGGSDPSGVTAAVAETITRTDWWASGGELGVVLGPNYQAREPWNEWPSGWRSRVSVERDPGRFLSLCLEADLVVCSASTISHEMACLGHCFVPLAFVDNQERIAEGWAAAGVSPVIHTGRAGWQDHLAGRLQEAIADDRERERVGRLAMTLVDGGGADRILAACGTLPHAHL